MASLRFRLRQRYWRWMAPGKISAYLRDTASPRLQIGAGYNLLSGWLNTTLYPFAPGAIYLDASQPFPLPSAAFDYVFSEHVIEHIEFEEAALMLSESARVLKGGGRIRLATPDLTQVIAILRPAKRPGAAGLHPLDNGQFPPPYRRVQSSAGHQSVLSRLAAQVHL